MAQEIKDASCYPLITQKLVERGHDAKVIRLILGENLFRVMRTVLG
jgi:microsomal dipeptidase-like Zn-dependent dipeptidase